MEFQFIYYTKSTSFRYFPSTTPKEVLLRILETTRIRFLLYFQGSSIQFLDVDNNSRSIEDIVTNIITPIFVYVPDATQNNKFRIKPTRDLNSIPLTKSSSFTINPNGILTEYLGKHPNIGKDNKAPFLVSAAAKPVVSGNVGYTLEDVKKHNKKNDCWIIIENQVYDITNYLRFHPGGDIILDAAGKDGTSLHQHYHPWVNVQRLIGKYQIGFLKR